MNDSLKSLSTKEIKSLLNILGNGWKNKFTQNLYKEFEFTSFLSAVAFVNQVAKVAEEQDHHPDIKIHSYKKVLIEISTHEAEGVTYKDFDLAKGIEKINE